MAQKKKKMTIEDLAGATQKGFVKMEKRFEYLAGAIEDLAGMTQRGFIELDNKLSTKIDKVANDLANLAETNASEHLDIKLRLDNTAHRSEMVELEKRVDGLEKKTGIKAK